LSTPPRRPTTTSTRRERRAAAQGGAPIAAGPSPLARYRTQIIWGVGAIALVIVGALFFFNATTPAYACTLQWTAPATPTGSPEPGATARLGYVQDDLGRGHVSPGTEITYPLCPPASGQHVNITGQGPIKPGVFKPSDKTYPQGWIHNLEHGGLVLLYKCSSDACPEYDEAAMKALYAAWPAGPICGTAPGVVGPIIARFDEMAYPYAALLWGQVLPLQTLDTAQVVAFFNQQGERSNPEKACAVPSPTPGPTAAPTTVPTAAPTTAPTTAPTAGPSAS